MNLTTLIAQREAEFEKEFLNTDSLSSKNQFRTELSGRLPEAFISFHRTTIRMILEAVDKNMEECEWGSPYIDRTYEHTNGEALSHNEALITQRAFIQEGLANLKK